MNCDRCNHKLAQGKALCSFCSHWNLDNVDAPEKGDEEDEEGEEAPPEIFVLDNVEAADKDRLLTGYTDRAWGGGITRTTVTMLSGEPGAGKSTLIQQILESVLIANPEEDALYLAVEESPEDLKARGLRLGTTTRKRVKGVYHPASELAIGLALQKIRPCIVVLDSLSDMVGDDYGYAVRVITVLKAWAKEHKCPTIMIVHITKGDDFAGRIASQHKVDTTMTLTVDKATKTTILETRKNRHGAVGASSRCVFAMTEKGLVYCPEKSTVKVTGRTCGDCKQSAPNFHLADCLQLKQNPVQWYCSSCDSYDGKHARDCPERNQ